MNERVVSKPRNDVGDALERVSQRARGRRRQQQAIDRALTVRAQPRGHVQAFAHEVADDSEPGLRRALDQQTHERLWRERRHRTALTARDLRECRARVRHDREPTACEGASQARCSAQAK